MKEITVALGRHEALHDDVTEHERTKEKRFEEEMEVSS